ncbi:MAG: bifunctional phosphopantothenoylcysteine decarboxylase/phosphopantothenate--cysteine ligase CoaBC, partial [Gammaproteobacteria bacterium]|nr:bifunctional phosphopantothenoylcysteine decarboxylase/phosphopantothenate--cysteine ligase CoaBC [Gammaproteobacteria bacterium]
LSGARVLVSAGPTREALDPVRYISNRSSGKMGYAIAEAAAEAGARVTLVSGPVSLVTPERVARVDVVSAGEMQQAVLAHAGQSDIFIAAAAVADYRALEPAQQKMKKDRDTIDLALARNADILESVRALARAPFTVGFAAETENLEQNAEAKRRAKKLDMVAANRVDRAGTGFDSDENELELFWEGGRKHLPRAPKSRLARELISVVAERFHAKNPA